MGNHRTALVAVLVTLATFGVARSYDPSSSNLNLGAVLEATQLKGQVILWLDGDTGAFSDSGFVTPATNSSTVGSWRDQGPLGNDVAQATTASRPSYATNALNGHNVVTFTGDGHTAGQTLSSTFEVSSDRNWWLICVISDGTVSWSTRGGDSTNYYCIANWSANGTTGFIPFGGNTNQSPNTSGGNYTWVVGTSISGVAPFSPTASKQITAPSSGYHVFSALCGQYTDIRLDGVTVSANLRQGTVGSSGGGGNANGTGVIVVGGSSQFTSPAGGGRVCSYNGKLATIVVGIGIPGVTNIHRIEKAIGARYALTVN